MPSKVNPEAVSLMASGDSLVFPIRAQLGVIRQELDDLQLGGGGEAGTAIVAKFAEIDGKIAGLDQRLTTLDEDTTAEFGVVNGQITDLLAQVAAHDQTIAVMQGQIDDLEGAASAPVIADQIVMQTLAYDYNTNTEDPPSNQQIRMDDGDQTKVTKLYLDDTTADSADARFVLSLLEAGRTIIVQDKNDSGNAVTFTVTGVLPRDGFTQIGVELKSSRAQLPSGRCAVAVFFNAP